MCTTKYFLETICGWQKNVPTPSKKKKKKVYVLIPGICDLMWQESICRCDFETGRGPRLPSQAQCKQQRSFKRGAGGVREGGERLGSRNGVN